MDSAKAVPFCRWVVNTKRGMRMSGDRYHKDQSLNAYVEMLDGIYGPSQNYAKSRAEIFQHLAEVCGIAGKHLFKKPDVERAALFIPKIFGWACALVSAVDGKGAALEDIVLRKFPQICPYCTKAPCECWNGPKPDLNEDAVKNAFYERSKRQARTVNDFELMFESIYGHTWTGMDGKADELNYIYLRMMEELAEVSEALRFHHLYPKNFENEIADFLGWWFALAAELRKRRSSPVQLTDQLLWTAYPGHCRDCESAPCFCPQGPVRELMSKPPPGSFHDTDALTSLRNQGAYKKDLAQLESGSLTVAKPIACVRLDVDKFKLVNDRYGHNAGDAALKHIASVIRQKCRPRDRAYRISGDEFGVLMPDTTEEEAYGMMRRVLSTLASSDVQWTSSDGEITNFTVSVSIGVAECEDVSKISAGFEAADAASYQSKEAGRARVTKASDTALGS